MALFGSTEFFRHLKASWQYEDNTHKLPRNYSALMLLNSFEGQDNCIFNIWRKFERLINKEANKMSLNCHAICMGG